MTPPSTLGPMRAFQLFQGRAYERAIGRAAAELSASSAVLPRQVGPASVFNEPNALQAIVWADLTGQPNILNRDAVMAIPAVARQRHLLVGTLARCPLVAYAGDTRVDTPLWMSRTDRAVSPYHRMLWTADDILFHGWSMWSAERGSERQLLHAERIALERWEVDEFGRIVVDGELAEDGEVIAIPGPHEGILNFGGNALRRTMDNLDAAANAARNPSAYLNLHYTGDDPKYDRPEVIKEQIAMWAAARRGENGGVAWTNKYIEVNELGTHEAHLLVEGRNADAVDVSRLMSSPAAMADATNAGASLTYETTEGRNGEFIDYGVGLYMDAIAARLSMDDVVPRGQRAAFDTSQLRNLSPDPTGPATED